MPLYDICLFSSSDSDCCSVHNFSVTPSIFLSLAVPSPLFSPLVFCFAGERSVVRGEGKQAPIPWADGNPGLKFFVAEH